jgi:hypothetical protein
MTSIGSRIKATIAAARATSRPVWVFLAVEAVAAVALGLAVGLAAAGTVGGVALDELPPWRALAALPAAGAAGHIVWAARPAEAVRRWHGIAVRRIDERWAADR